MKNIIFAFCCLLLLQDVTGQGTIKLDKSFGKNGFVRTSLSGNANTMSAATRNCFVTGNNRILVVAEFNAEVMVSRRLSGGGIDSSYGINGFSDHVNINQPAAAMQKDGKIIVVGSNGAANSDFILARFNTTGSLDGTFGNGGVIITDLGSDDDIPGAVLVQKDGKIIAAGQTLVNGVAEFALVRYNPNGSTDITFGNKGFVFTNFGNTSNITALAQQADGKIVAVGNYFNGSNGDFAIARYNSNGTPDPGFNGTGEVVADFGNSDNAVSTALQTDGKIIVGGYYVDPSFNSHFELARFMTNGLIDSSFNGSGVTTTDFGNAQDYLAAIAIQENGAIVAGGYTYEMSGLDDLALTRFKATGSIDSSFGNSGKVVTDIDSSYDVMNCLSIQTNGKILSGGYSSINFLNYFTAIQYNGNGSLDANFGSGGIVIGYYPDFDISYSTVLLQTDGKPVVSGQTSDGVTGINILSRFNPDGSVDKSYGQKGVANSGGFYAVMQSDNKVVNASYLNTENGTEFVMSRYKTNGNIDPSYGTNGTTVIDFFGGNESVGPTAIQKDNKVVVAGFIYNALGSDLLMARFNTDGMPDPTFGTGGAAEVDFEPYDFGQAIAVSKDLKILSGGYGLTSSFDLVAVLSLFKPNGSVDSSFGQSGKIVITSQGGAFSGTVAFQNDGKILYAYEASPDFSNYYSFINRYNPDGSLDSSFGQNGTIPVDGSSIFLQSDQKILVDGRTTNLQNNIDFKLSRYNVNGSKDLSFGNQGSIVTSFTSGDDYMNDLILSGNQLYAAGDAMDPNSKGLLAKYLLSNVNSAADSVVKELDITQLPTGWLVTAVPNPSNSLFRVSISSTVENDGFSLRLISLQGNVAQTISSVQPGESVMIGSSNLPSGIYFLQVIGRHSTRTIKLVKY